MAVVRVRGGDRHPGDRHRLLVCDKIIVQPLREAHEKVVEALTKQNSNQLETIKSYRNSLDRMARKIRWLEKEGGCRDR